MALPITNLPNELLMNIISYLDLPSAHSTYGWSKGDVRPTLCALAVTCRRLSTLSKEFMLRDVKVATGWLSSIYPLYTTDRLRKFVRTCREKPDTINYIRSLEIQADFSATPDWGVSEDDRTPDLILQTISQSSSLCHLRLLLPGVRSLQWLPSLFPDHHLGKLFARLQSFHLDCGNGPITPSLFLCLCALPSLKHVETPSPVKYDSSISYPYGMSSLMDPSIAWLGKGASEVLETINAPDLSSVSLRSGKLFDKMPKLKELHISVPGPGVAFDDHEYAHHRVYTSSISAPYNFSPVQLQMWLSPVASTLRSLSMANPRVLIVHHDGSLFNFSNFSQLEHLKISIHFLCPASLGNAQRVAPSNAILCAPARDFYHLLPRSIQTLEIHYDSDQGIFYDPNHLYKAYHAEDFSAHNLLLVPSVPRDQILRMMYNELWLDRFTNIDYENGVRDRLGWLLAFRHVRAKVLPKLTVLTVRKTYARDWVWKDFDLAARYPNVFVDEALEINVVLRAPKKWDPPVLPLHADDSWKFVKP